MPRQALLTAENNLLVPKQAAFLCHFSNLSFEHTSLNLSDSLPFSIIPFSFFFLTESTVENGDCSENLQVLGPLASPPTFHPFLLFLFPVLSLASFWSWSLCWWILESEYDGREHLVPRRESECSLDVGAGSRTTTAV